MKKDCGIPPQKVQVDGGMTSNQLLMQLQSDLIGLDVIKPEMAESTALVRELKCLNCKNALSIHIFHFERVRPWLPAELLVNGT